MSDSSFNKQRFQPHKPRKSYRLDFRTGAKSPKEDSDYGSNISGLAVMEQTLFCASDETGSIERLEFDGGRIFRNHRSYSLGKLFPDLAAARKEADIEGLAIDGGYLWITGSHSLKRSVPVPAGTLGDFAAVTWDPKRAFLGRVPIAADDSGRPTLVPTATENDVVRRSAMLAMGRGADDGLRGILRGNAFLAPYVGLPSKENGLDVEGLAVSGDYVVLGLRGPVLGSHAFIVVLLLPHNGDGVLIPKNIDSKPYRLHALFLGGLGIRDLLFDGNRLLILAGPAQKTECMQRVYAIDDFLNQPEVVARNDEQVQLTLPTAGWGDHAEGIAFFREKGKKMRLLVAYDSANERFDADKDRLMVDTFDLPD